jgi:hypothetical protein
VQVLREEFGLEEKIKEQIGKVNANLDQIYLRAPNRAEQQQLCDGLKKITEAFERIPRMTPEYKNSYLDRVREDKDEILQMGEDRGTIFMAAVKLEVTCNNFVIVQFEKLSELLFEFCYAMARNKILNASMLARAIHEMAAFNCYISKNVEKKLANIERQKEPSKVVKNIELLLKFIEKAFYGSSSNATGISFIDVKHGREELNKLWRLEASSYNRLCDFVHPNYGSNILYGSGFLDNLRGIGYNPLAAEQFKFLVSHVPIVSIHAEQFLMHMFSRVLFFGELKEKTKDQSVKLENLFSDRKSKSEGRKNGNSFEDAFDLTNMGHSESVKAEYRILEKLKLKVRSRSVEKHKEALYDVFITNKGKIFFKSPLGW